ncbi:hypothetical protein BURCENBC7_AP0444 [Burkholderia cenocepacia BC7]|nr:hypothetical protein BURCENK562V_C3678 [Burkholderia cenocepacia K56-2Valvano]ERI29107.1 hypothetical protein BURCENBC7_AP0444 [Burkholderia cenocepacia BC7]
MSVISAGKRSFSVSNGTTISRATYTSFQSLKYGYLPNALNQPGPIGA